MMVRQGVSSILTRSCLADLQNSTEGILTKVERTRRAKKLLFPDLNDDIHEGNELEMDLSGSLGKWMKPQENGSCDLCDGS